MHDTTLSELEAVAEAMADAARIETLRYFRGDALDTRNKESDGAYDPVTVADKAAERVMRQILAERRPDDAIYGEEYGRQPGTTGLTWILDPIDGTRAFVCGTASWGVLISVEDAGGPILGIIDQPYTEERFIGSRQGGRLIWRGGLRTLRTRAARPLEDALMLSTFPEIGTEAERLAFERVRDRVQLTRYGLDCYGYALLALGQVDLVIEAGLSAYDISAPIAVIEAAGGIVTDWNGGPVHGGGQVLAAANEALHGAALALLQGD